MKKKFEIPVANVVTFDDSDIIVTSGDYGDNSGIIFPTDPAEDD